MSVEYEAKVIDVETDAIFKRIMARVGERLLGSYVYDINPDDKSQWIRLQDTGTEIILTVKEIVHDKRAGNCGG